MSYHYYDYANGVSDYKYYGKYIAVYANNYIGIYVDEDVMEQELQHYENPRFEQFKTKYEAACYIQDGLYYDLGLYHIGFTDWKRIHRLAVNHKHFPSVALESSFERRAEKERFINERRERKKQSRNYYQK